MKRYLAQSIPHIILALLLLVPLTVTSTRGRLVEGGSPRDAISSTPAESSAEKASIDYCPGENESRANTGIEEGSNENNSTVRTGEDGTLPCALAIAEDIRVGEAAENDGDLQASIRAWEMAIRNGTSPASVYERLTQAYLDRGDYHSAVSNLQALANEKPTDARLHYQLGLLKSVEDPDSALGDLSLAAEIDASLAVFVRAFERAIKAARFAADPAYSLVTAGQSLASVGKWKLAALAFTNAVQFRPDYAEAWAFLGESRQHLSEDGLPDLQHALALDPDSTAANILLSLYWERQGRYDLALVYLHKADDLDPGNPDLKTELGGALASLGELPGALRYYRKAIELAPREPKFDRLLAEFCIRYEYLAREVGLPAARRAVLNDPKDPASLDTMAQVLYYLGDPLSALRFSQRSLAADPSYAPARLHLSLVYLRLDEKSLAREQLDLARTLAPGTIISDQATRLMDRLFP